MPHQEPTERCYTHTENVRHPVVEITQQNNVDIEQNFLLGHVADEVVAAVVVVDDLDVFVVV